LSFMNKIVIEFFASFFLWLMFAGIFVLWIYDGKIKKEQALHALFAGILAWVLVAFIKSLFPTLRPFMLNGRPTDVLIPPSDGSFPSGHTATAFALAVTIWKHDKKVGVFYLLAALAVGVARVLANVHYPVDILGGAVLGILSSLATEKLHLKA